MTEDRQPKPLDPLESNPLESNAFESKPLESNEPYDEQADEQNADAIRSLLRRAAAGEPVAHHAAPNLLPAVQRKIRQRSKGKFFGDGWSTTQTRVSYVTVSLVMLVILGCAYFALGPTGFH